ncbi:MAG: hypothetical protein ABFD54_13815 [Armatimonadota bacterium]|nr:hypothetical protein [bacterium]
MMRWLIPVLLLILVPGILPAEEPAVFTSTRYVVDMAFSANGALWVATRGGVLCRNADGSWRKFTVEDGLPSNEARRINIYLQPEKVLVDFPKISSEWSGGKWTAKQMVQMTSKVTVFPYGHPTPAIEPSSHTGSHVSARCSADGRAINAMFGDCLYEYIDDHWTRLDIDLPAKAREITAITSKDNAIWLGTRDEGVWEYDGKVWTQHLQPNEPYSHNIQCIAEYQGNVYFSTLEEGLVVLTKDEWRHISRPEMSSNAPRQMVKFGGSLYIRHGDGKVDRRDGDKWTKDICANLPRKQVSAIASDSERLYAAQWGGWSEFDGKTWTHHLKFPELQGCAITAILPQKDTIWIGTQGRGLAEIDRTSKTVRMHDERNGLTDDWIKCIACAGNTVYAGTFVSGLFTKDGNHWLSVPGIGNTEITDLRSDASGSILATTRSEVWQRASDGAVHRLDPRISEAQAICACENGTWVGTRTGIWFLPASR